MFFPRILRLRGAIRFHDLNVRRVDSPWRSQTGAIVSDVISWPIPCYHLNMCGRFANQFENKEAWESFFGEGLPDDVLEEVRIGFNICPTQIIPIFCKDAGEDDSDGGSPKYSWHASRWSIVRYSSTASRSVLRKPPPSTAIRSTQLPKRSFHPITTTCKGPIPTVSTRAIAKAAWYASIM